MGLLSSVVSGCAQVKMKVPLPVLLVLVALLAFARAAPTWEAMYVDSLSNSSVRAFAHNYTATAHLAGTEEDYQSALYTQAQLQLFADVVEVQAINASLTKKYSEDAKPNDELNAFNERIRMAERSWLSTEGLAAQGRPYFRHVVQAPALYNGYGSDPFPGLAQAIRDRKWSVAKDQIEIIVARMKSVRNVFNDDQAAENETVVIVLAAVWGGICVLALVVLVLYFAFRVVKNRRGSYETLGASA